MNRFIPPVAIGVAVLALMAGSAVTGYEVHQLHEVVTVTRTVPRTVMVTRWKTKTVADGMSVPCSEVSPGVSGPAFLVVGNLQAEGYNGTYEGMCSVLIFPGGAVTDGKVTLTDPSGLKTIYNLTPP